MRRAWFWVMFSFIWMFVTWVCFSSVQFSRSVMSDSLQPHEPQHARPSCPSPAPGFHPNPCPLSQWCHSVTSSSVVPFSSCLQSFQTSGSFQMSQLFASGDSTFTDTLFFISFNFFLCFSLDNFFCSVLKFTTIYPVMSNLSLVLSIALFNSDITVFLSRSLICIFLKFSS